MTTLTIHSCPGMLSEGFQTYSRTALNRVFNGRKVSHILPYASPNSNDDSDQSFTDNRKRLSISGVQEKFSIVQEKNTLRLTQKGERGTHILKPIPGAGKNSEYMPANEHLTMQIAKQIFGIETAENAMIFFKDYAPAYITKRFDVRNDGSKWAQEDFASLAKRTPQSHGDNYKYEGNYLQIFNLLKKYVPAYPVEAPKLFKLILFNYLMSNGDAHYKNFSLIETALGDFKLSPAYDLLNSRFHIDDRDFALTEGLLPPQDAKGKVREQFVVLSEKAGIPKQVVQKTISLMTIHSEQVKQLISQSFLPSRLKRNFEQAYLTRLKKLMRV